MATKFIETGNNATSDFTFWTSTAGTVTTDTGTVTNGHAHSVRLNTSNPAVSASVKRDGILAAAGRRISFYWQFSALPSANNIFFAMFSSGGTTGVASASLRTDGTLSITGNGGTAAIGTTVLSAGTWYRLCISYFVTNTTTYKFQLYINGVAECAATVGTLASAAPAMIEFRAHSAWGINHSAYVSDVYVDDGASSGSQPDTGDTATTFKRPFANGTTNGFTTQIGTGPASPYGTGHAQQVNENPLNAANGWSITTSGVGVREEYNIEGISTGEIDLTNHTIRGIMGWLYGKASSGETCSMILDSAIQVITFPVNTNTFLFSTSNSTITYPAGTGTDIGILTDTSSQTVSLYETGIVFAYNPASNVTTSTGNFFPFFY